jgi:hypothetical protein
MGGTLKPPSFATVSEQSNNCLISYMAKIKFDYNKIERKWNGPTFTSKAKC